jgi:hypothetical protein
MFETDTAVEREGVWLEYAPGVEIRIARAGGSNQHFTKTLQRLSKPHRRAIQAKVIDDDILQEIGIKAYAEAIVLDWRGITRDIITHNDDDGDELLDFTRENVVAVLKAQPNLFLDIQKAADDIALYRSEINEADSKN